LNVQFNGDPAAKQDGFGEGGVEMRHGFLMEVDLSERSGNK